MKKEDDSERTYIKPFFRQKILRILKLSPVVLIIAFLLALGHEAYSQAANLQPRTVTGTVMDENGETLPGVNIVIKGSTTGAVTDVNGIYSIEVGDPATILVISYVGHLSQEITVGDQTEISVTLMTDAVGLEEIVVVGYGTQTNKKVSAAISQVNMRELDVAKRPVINAQSALVGAIPGLILSQSNGEPGASVNIQVRETSALASRSALVLIDGFEGSISDLAPNAISTVTVLKDAAATSIYGARGANGVVLVTTRKTRRSERMRLTYSFNQSLQRPASTPEISNSLQFMEFSNEATLEETLRNNPGTDPSTVSLPFSTTELDRAGSGFYPETQWIDELYSENAGQSSHNISLEGGSGRTGYFLNLGSLNQNGLLVGSDNFRRYNVRMKIDSDITDWLTLGTNVSITNRNTNNVPVSEGYQIKGRPFFPVQLEDGTYVDKGASSGSPNPVGRATSGSYDKTKRDALNLQLYGQLKPIKGLVIEERVALTRSNAFREIWETPFEYAILDMELNQVGNTIPVLPADRSLWMRSSRDYSLHTLTTVNYELLVNDQHSLSVLAGLQTQEGEDVRVEASRFNFILPNLQDLKLGQEINELGNSSDRGGNRTTLSYFGRIGYDYKGKYLAEFNFRADASSNFGPNNKWGYFPAFSVGWNIMEEQFLNSAEFIDILKIRASWGMSGDDGSINVVERAPFDPTGSSLGGVVIPTIRLGNSINPDLKWETSVKTNIGIDISLGKGIFALSSEYFIDNRRDIITELLTSSESGLGGVLDNVYNAKSWGWEFDLSHRYNVGEFRWSASFNITYYNSEITNTEGVSPLDFSATNYQDIGLPIQGNLYGFEVDGFFDDQAEMDANVDGDGNPIDQSAVCTGDALGRYLGGFKYMDQITVDTDGDGIADAMDGVVNADDRVVLATNTDDNFRFGFNLGATYQGFSLSARFYGVLKGVDWWRGNNLRPFTGDVASWVYQTDSWRPDNPDALFPQATASNILPYNDVVDYLIHKNSYIKIKNINLSYALNQDILERLKVINGLDVYISVENLGAIWSNSPSFEYGWDPEFGTGNFRYPLPLTMSFGINVTY